MAAYYLCYVNRVPWRLIYAASSTDAETAARSELDRGSAPLGYRIDLQPETSAPFEDKQEIIVPPLSAFGRRAEDRKP